MLLFTVKFIHSLVLLYMLACLFVIWQYGLTGFFRRWMPLALSSIALEGAVWFGNGMRCPLTDWAIELGDESGADLLSDIILVQPVDVVSGYAAFFVLGLCLAVRRFWLERQAIRSNHQHKRESIKQYTHHESITH